MNIAIITSDSYFSYLLISDLVKNRKEDISAIVITPNKMKGKGTFGTAIHVLKKTGFRNFVYKVVSYIWFVIAEQLHKIGIIRHCITPSNLAKRFGIDLLRSDNCNDKETIDYLKKIDIDILFSINVYQRMKEDLLSIPKLAAINNHFGLLPKYKGMAPYIWAMANNEKEFGLSVHHMVLEFDEGKLIKQETMPLKSGDSAMWVYLRACGIARKMIAEAAKEIESDPDAGFDQQGEGSYFSMPTRECIKNLRKNGYKLWKVADLLSVFSNTINGEQLP